MASSAGVLEQLIMPLGELAVAGRAFSLAALSARAVSMLRLERDGMGILAEAREDLCAASVSFAGRLFCGLVLYFKVAI